MHGVAAQVRLQLRRRALHDDLSLGHDREPVGELVGLFEVVRRQQDRQRLGLGEARDLGPHPDARLGVEAGGRLVEEQHPGAVDETERDVEPAPHPAGVGLDDAVRRFGDPDELAAARRRAARSAPAAHPLHAALEHQVLAAGAVLVDARVLRHVADRAAHGVRLTTDVVAGDRGRALVRVRERDEHAHGRRLAGTVRAEQPEDLAFAHVERDAVECLDLAVALAQLLDDDRFHRRRG